MKRRLFLLMACALPACAFAQTSSSRPTMSVREAYQRTKAGEVILIDIRRPDEWADTGVPEGAIRLDMTSPVFEARLAGLRAENPGKRLGMICRTGSRTRHVQDVLGKRGWTGIIDVRGGMLGDGRNKGWLDEGLPLGK